MRLKFKTKLLVNLLTIALFIVLLLLMNETETSTKLSSLNVAIITKAENFVNETLDVDEYVSKYTLVEYDRRNLTHPASIVLKYQNATDLNLKYVLFWTFCDFNCWGRTQTQKVDNCIFTTNRYLLKAHEFDAVLFHVGEVWKPKRLWMVPDVRSAHQNYIMYTHE
jgi:hypothetical protein